MKQFKQMIAQNARIYKYYKPILIELGSSKNVVFYQESNSVNTGFSTCKYKHFELSFV